MTSDEIEKDRALERIWAEAPGVIDDMGFWQPNQSAGLEAYVRSDLFDAMTAERDRLREALEWYGEQARLCRLIHGEGDAGRQALSNDGGQRARAALGEKNDG